MTSQDFFCLVQIFGMVPEDLVCILQLVGFYHQLVHVDMFQGRVQCKVIKSRGYAPD